MLRPLLRDDQWDRIKGLLPGKRGDPGATAGDNRLFVEAVLWIGRTGAPGATFRRRSGNGTVCTRVSTA